jgi:1-deoxy-D-xylulose-5-phosphate reductoisomerase
MPSVALLGATGSIGTQTLDVLRAHRDEFTLVALAGGQRLAELAATVNEFSVPAVAVRHEDDATTLRGLVPASTEILVGPAGLEELAGRADICVNAVVGFAGLSATLGALRAGRRLALANKESLVAAAPVVERVRQGQVIYPIDSEHSAIFQCLGESGRDDGYREVSRIILTASGGPFRTWPREDLQRVTREQALRHPTWAMGAKITIDSSTLMNKGLEVLEASALFGIELDRVDVVVHPQSIVHSMVEYIDGATLAQLSEPDMRLPIAVSLGAPHRLAGGFGRMDFSKNVELTFEAPRWDDFPALRLAYDAGRRGHGAPTWLSAANEIAVEAFLDDRLAWCDIVPVVAATLDSYDDQELVTEADVWAADAAARDIARRVVAR